jgi:putative membrane protein
MTQKQPSPTKQIYNRNNFFYRILCGFFLGIAVIAPGVSGSVMAVMMGIYDELITIISNPFKNFKKNFIFLFPMGIGGIISVVSLIQVLKIMFERYPIPAFLLFFGLIGGSLPTIFREANKNGFKKKYLFGVIIAFIFAAGVGLIARSKITLSSGLNDSIYLPISGGIAGMMSMIPGMSISMILMTLGAYSKLLHAAAGFQIMTIAPVGICFVIGMFLFSRITKFVFDKYRNFAYFMVFGFVLGTLISIFPGIPKDLTNWVLSLIMTAVGFYVSTLFQKLGVKFKTID